MKLLTIVIPTHNRCEFLKNNLIHLLPQVLLNKSNVDLLVSDNHSDDDTKQVVAEFQQQYPNCLIYNRNDKDEGYLYNFNIGVHLANSRFVYLLGDDDLVPDGFVTTIIELLNKHTDIGLIHLNYLRLSNRTHKIDAFYNNKLPGEIGTMFEFRDFLMEFFDGPTFMSSLVFKRDLWIKGENRFEENCYGYDWLMKLFAGCSGCKCYYHNMPLMIQVDSGTNPYNKLWALYSIVGKSKMFKNLDNEISGIYKAWQKYRETNFLELYDIFTVSYNKVFYRARTHELSKYISSKHRVIIMYIVLYFLPSCVTKWSIIPLFKAFVLLRGIL